MNELGFDKSKFEIIDPNNFEKINVYTQEFYKLRQRKGITSKQAHNLMQNPYYFGAMMVYMNDAHALIGVLGQNAIGKTTFIKILAGEIKADDKDLDIKLKVSYKPQYIDLNEDITVQELFLKKEINQDIFNSEIRRQLDIDSIIDQEINQLSGGELQKVAIAYTLSRNADIYLIDEPSAFLDVEQRLIVSNVIKSVILKTEKSALVVDHDLLFVDYISDRVLLFQGEASVKGFANKIDKIEASFNKFLKEQNMTFRQDPDTKRPRANKPDSQKDKEQRKDNSYYYTI